MPAGWAAQIVPEEAAVPGTACAPAGDRTANEAIPVLGGVPGADGVNRGRARFRSNDSPLFESPVPSGVAAVTPPPSLDEVKELRW